MQVTLNDAIKHMESIYDYTVDHRDFLAWQKIKSELAQLSHNNGSMPLCRSCIKLHACLRAGDLTRKCKEYQVYAANGTRLPRR
jgi:hypothetical protein